MFHILEHGRAWWDLLNRRGKSPIFGCERGNLDLPVGMQDNLNTVLVLEIDGLREILKIRGFVPRVNNLTDSRVDRDVCGDLNRQSACRMASTGLRKGKPGFYCGVIG